MTTLILKNIWKIYDGDVIGVEDLSITVNNGEFFALLGPSGCGKSSTLRMIAGLEGISKGEIWFDQQLVNHLEPRERNVAMVFETYALYPFLSVYENIAFPLRIRNLSRKQVDEKVRWAADFLGITELLPMHVRSLSGGQMQSVGIGRAIVREPSILLMDEPISHLEARQRARMREELVDLHEKLGTTTIYVTHDQVEAMTMADRIAIMNLGKLQQVGTPKEVYENPQTEFVGGFIGEPPMNTIDCELGRDNGTIYALANEFKTPLPLQHHAVLDSRTQTEKVRLGVRPESITVSRSQQEGAIGASVYVLEPQGERTILTAKLGAGNFFLIEVGPDFEAKVDEPIYLQLRQPIHLFDIQSGYNLLYQ